MAFREIGRGHAAMNTFCGYMNMPPPMEEIPESAVNNPWDTIRKIGSFVRTLSLIITPGVVLGNIRTPWAYIRKSYKIVLYLPLIHVYINQKLSPSPPPHPTHKHTLPINGRNFRLQAFPQRFNHI